jgi:hypothetical protein
MGKKGAVFYEEKAPFATKYACTIIRGTRTPALGPLGWIAHGYGQLQRVFEKGTFNEHFALYPPIVYYTNQFLFINPFIYLHSLTY